MLKKHTRMKPTAMTRVGLPGWTPPDFPGLQFPDGPTKSGGSGNPHATNAVRTEP